MQVHCCADGCDAEVRCGRDDDDDERSEVNRSHGHSNEARGALDSCNCSDDVGRAEAAEKIGAAQSDTEAANMKLFRCFSCDVTADILFMIDYENN